MLIKVDYEECIRNILNRYDEGLEIINVNGNIHKEGNNARNESTALMRIKNVITENIELQYALSWYYYSLLKASSFQDIDTILNGQQHVIGLSCKLELKDQLEAIIEIFKSVALLKYNGKTMGIKVSNPKAKALLVFKGLAEEEKLNRWIAESICGKNEQGLEIEAYQLIPDFSKEEVNKEIYKEVAEDELIEYLSYRRNEKIETNCIRVSGTLKEIEDNERIRALSLIVPKLYVFTMADYDYNNNVKVFTKYIGW